MAFPILLSGNTLGQRQQELNVRVRQAATENVPFEQIKDEAEQTDVDRLFKIDLASKYKHVEYIIDVLKCGDSLYISRALRSVWLYDEEFSNIINPDYLHHNLFPSMSSRMQRKFLTATSMHVRDEKRNEIFYHYCVTWRLPAIAKKFLIFTSVQFKKHMIDNELDSLQRLLKPNEIIKNFIGENISLAECYLDKQTCSEILYLLRPFYFIDPQTYLDWTEQSYKNGTFGTCYTQLGTRISKDIVTKHKQRVINNIELYVELLKRSTLVKYTTIEDAKQCLIRLLPEDDRVFWNREFYSEYNFLIDIIPKEDQYNFMETIFIEKYSGRPFEMADEFLRQKYHLLMSTERREAWAMHHIALDKETSARDRNYFWFKFVNFDMALEAIKSYVLITPEDHKRAKVLKILVESARSLTDLEKLLNYFYQRHVNEAMTLKAEFMRKVIEQYNIFEYNDNCWQAFQKLLHSLEVYNPDDGIYNHFDLKLTVLVYHIINNLEIPVSLKKVLGNCESWAGEYDIKKYAVKLKDEKKTILYQFLFDLQVNRAIELDSKERYGYNEDKLAHCLSGIHYLQTCLKIDDDNLPEIVLKLMKSKVLAEEKDNDKISQFQLIRILKTNAVQVIDERPKVRYSIDFCFTYNIFLKKLRVYFMNDIAHEFLQFFTECLSANAKEESRLILCSVYGIFQIADVKYKTEFIEKYIPVNPKIDHSQIDRDYLYIQEGICRYAGTSRPPVPLRTIRKYITGDYLQYCEPMFGMYMANLRPSEKLQFVESLLDSPVSIQKHALRLAFECFNTKDLQSLIKRVWRKHKNISLRMVIYTHLFTEVVQRKDASRDELFKCLLELMSDVNEDDHIDVLNLLAHCNKDHVNLRRRRGRRSRYSTHSSKSLELPEEFKAVYIETAWKTVSKFPIKKRNAELRVAVLKKMDQNVEKIDKTILRAVVDDYFDIMFNKNGIELLAEYANEVGDDRGVIEAKGSLVFSFIKSYPMNTDSVELVKSVLHNCFEKWNEVKKVSNPERNFYFIRDYCYRFISDLIDKCYPVRGKAVAINEILECILSELQNFLPMHEIYSKVWQLRLLIMTSKLMEEAKDLCEENNLFEAVIIKFAQQVCALVKEFVTKQMFCALSIWNISDELTENMERLNSTIRYSYNSYDIRIVFALNLLDYGTHETDLLAAYLIPDIGSGSCDKLSILTQKLEACDHFEIKTLMYERFKEKGFKKLI